MRPDEIENLSFKIIDQEAREHNFSSQEWAIVRRMIHTSADFDYIKTVRFHPDAIASGINALKNGKKVITDTKMAAAGISGKRLSSFGAEVTCLIDDPHVLTASLQSKKTRAHEAVEAAVNIMDGGIYVIGNAPTALLHIISLIERKKVNPALIVGFPVGFVNAFESKTALAALDFPYITNVDRKGGSNIAASVVNALAIIAADKSQGGC
jgi:precorrin-8X/cobalt-precorrin-8 methylmutase